MTSAITTLELFDNAPALRKRYFNAFRACEKNCGVLNDQAMAMQEHSPAQYGKTFPNEWVLRPKE